jgi:sugar phosphate isomerase/epimerase
MFRELNLKFLGLTATQAEQIELALSHGFRGISLDLVEFHARVQAQGLAHARRLFDSAKIRLGTFELPFDPCGSEEHFQAGLERLKPLAETAAAVGCVRAFTSLAPGSDERPYHQNFEFHRRRYNEVAATLAPWGIRLGVAFSAIAERQYEFEFIRTFDALALLIATVASRNVGVVIDLWQIWRAGGKVDDIRKLVASQIVAVRIADAPAEIPPNEAGLDSRLVPGESGTIDGAKALRMLAELGFDGPVTPNPDRGQFRGLGRDAIVRKVGQGLDKIWKESGLTPSGRLAAVKG